MSIDVLKNKNRPIRLLLVEDNRGDVILIKRAFLRSQTPYEITVARTGEEALQIVREAPDGAQADMIILDLNLPGLSGHQVLCAIKNHERLRRIPVFILSSSSAEADVVECYNAHANCYIVKPHTLETLCEIADRIEAFWFSLAVLPNGESGKQAA